jgi:hypothetical protein
LELKSLFPAKIELLPGGIGKMGIFSQKFTTEVEDLGSPEHYLWISVLSKAAHDAMYSSDWREARLAIAWFKGKGSGFRKVCEFAGKDHNYVHARMMKAIVGRENNMEAVKSGARLYVKNNPTSVGTGVKVFHSHYRGLGRHRKPQRMATKLGRPKKKNMKMVFRGSKGGRPRLYDGI